MLMSPEMNWMDGCTERRMEVGREGWMDGWTEGGREGGMAG